jgi:hypothetical protein
MMTAQAAALAASVTVETVRRITLALPGVEEVRSWDGTPSFRVRKTSFVRLREDGDTLVTKVNYYERRFLIEADPDAFFVTDDLRVHPWMLVRLPVVAPAALRERIEEAWRLVAPKRLVAEYDRAHA